MTAIIIDLSKLLSNVESEVKLNEIISYDKEYLNGSGIEELNDVSVVGTLKKDSSEEVIVDLDVKGIMIILDSVSNEPVQYPFSFKMQGEITDFVENYKNMLDISEVLWENIVLEIPLKFTKVKDLSKFHGDGWKVISEDDPVSSTNPFNELLKNWKEE